MLHRFIIHWRLRWKSHLGTLAVALAAFVAVQAWQTRGVATGAPLPDAPVTLIAPDATVQTTTLHAAVAQLRRTPGQPVALHVWADWCPICRTEEGSISALAHNHAVLTVAMRSGDAAKVQRVQAQRGLPWATVVDEHGQLADQLGFKAVPAFVVVDGSGTLRAATVGYTTALGLRARLWWAQLTG